jgi:HlyD family secretion protein
MDPDKRILDGLRIDRASAPRGRSAVVLALIALPLLGVAGGLTWWFTRPKAAVVRTVVVQEARTAGGEKTLLNASGYVTARREATVSSKVTGKVVEVLVEEGMQVESGQVLARLDQSNVERSLSLAQAQLAAASSAVAETKANWEQAVREVKRITGLLEQRSASRVELERAETDEAALRGRLARQTADIAVSEREVALWEQQQDDTIIRAPFAGIVTTKNAQPGEMISPMSVGGFTRTGICTLVDMSSLEIEVDVSESYINRVVPGQLAEATLDAYPTWRIPAKVIAIIPTADRQKATVKVRVGFDQLDPRILPDMSVKVAFQSAAEAAVAQRTLTVPRAAVQQREGRDIVWIVRNGRVERRAVTVGAVNGDDVIVAAGVSGGDRVVVGGPDNLSDGAAVVEAR